MDNEKMSAMAQVVEEINTGLSDTDKHSIAALENDSDVIGIYSFYDLKAKRFDTPFFSQNNMFAMRHYKMTTEKEGTMLNRFKREFELHRIGYYHMDSGDIELYPELLLEGKLVYKEKD